MLGLGIREQDQQNNFKLNKRSSDGEGLPLAHPKRGVQSSAGVQGGTCLTNRVWWIRLCRLLVQTPWHERIVAWEHQGSTQPHTSPAARLARGCCPHRRPPRGKVPPPRCPPLRPHQAAEQRPGFVLIFLQYCLLLYKRLQFKINRSDSQLMCYSGRPEFLLLWQWSLAHLFCR